MMPLNRFRREEQKELKTSNDNRRFARGQRLPGIVITKWENFFFVKGPKFI